MDESAVDAAEPLDRAVVDLALKILARVAPEAFFRLAGMEVDPARIRHTDVTAVLKDRICHHVFVVTDAADTPQWGLYLECQLEPARRSVLRWAAKWGTLCEQEKAELILLALYLAPGDRATFPDRYEVRVGRLGTGFYFETIHLWEHADRIRSGELIAFAPLLVLWEEAPAETVVREELGLLREAGLPAEERADLLALAYAVGTKFLVRSILDVIFGEELSMLKDLGIISEWIEESEARGEARGKAEGEAEGRAGGVREMLLHVLERRLGPVPEHLKARIAAASPEWCHDALESALAVESFDELPSER